jgi:hypothetical protein
MDWRLIAALTAAACSIGLVAIGARAVLTASPPPPPQQKTAAVPALTAEQRIPVALARAPSLSPQTPPPPAFPTAASSGQAPRSPFAAADDSVFASGRADASSSLISPPLTADQSPLVRPQPRAGSHKTAALPPRDDIPEPPARPLVELHTAPPAPHYRGVLTSTEIARIKHSLRLTPDQEPAWPRVEAALSEMGRQQMALIKQGQEPRISQSDWPNSRLYSIAGPLLQTLRPDQKETVRRLCRSLGFESVAAML